MVSIWDGIIIGGARGAIAGLTVYTVKYLHERFKEFVDKRTVYNWLKETARHTIWAITKK